MYMCVLQWNCGHKFVEYTQEIFPSLHVTQWNSSNLHITGLEESVLISEVLISGVSFRGVPLCSRIQVSLRPYFQLMYVFYNMYMCAVYIYLTCRLWLVTYIL